MRQTLNAAIASFAMFTAATGAALMSQPAEAAIEDKEIGLAVGTDAPDATLKTVTGETIELSSFVGEAPVVVMFYRGGWCPYCNRSLSAWAEKIDIVKGLGAKVIAISPETVENAGETLEKNEFPYTILVDDQYSAADAFNVRFTVDDNTQTRYKGFGIDLEKANANGSWDLPHPGTFVIGTDGKIKYAWVQEDYTTRADPDEVIAVLRGL